MAMGSIYRFNDIDVFIYDRLRLKERRLEKYGSMSGIHLVSGTDFVNFALLYRWCSLYIFDAMRYLIHLF